MPTPRSWHLDKYSANLYRGSRPRDLYQWGSLPNDICYTTLVKNISQAFTSREKTRTIKFWFHLFWLGG